MDQQYHYHSAPYPGCLAILVDTAGQHSPIFGMMIDGVPVGVNVRDVWMMINECPWAAE